MPQQKTPFLQNELTEEDEVAVERNKKRGGGPRTPKGKERARGNATKHGVFAQIPVLPLVEDENEWLRLRQDVLDWFGLEGEFQESLGERVAIASRGPPAWRPRPSATTRKTSPPDWRTSILPPEE
jgi:hypothetical protein